MKTIEKTSNIVDTVIPYANKCFRKYGYKKTTVDEIASELHISKKTLYTVFPSKKDILRETIWRDTLEIMKVFRDTVTSGAQPDELLLSLCRFIFYDRAKRGKDGYYWGIYANDSDINSASLEALKRIIKAIYDEGYEMGLFKQIDVGLATEIIVNIIVVSTKMFHLSKDPVLMFNDTLQIIADVVAYKNRIKFDTLG